MDMRTSFLFLVLAALLSGSCGEKVDLSKNLEVIDVSTGWYDLGVIDGKNKLVPSLSFAFKNKSATTLDVLQANVVYRRVNEPDKEWGAMFVKVTGSEGLAPGATTERQTINSPLGYTGTESRQQMFENAQFADAKAQLYAKYSSAQWQLVGEYPVTRRLIEK